MSELRIFISDKPLGDGYFVRVITELDNQWYYIRYSPFKPTEEQVKTDFNDPERRKHFLTFF